MSGDHEDVQELLVELEYGELEGAERDAAQAHIDSDPDLIRMQHAFRAVRRDLATWDEVERQPARIAFVTMPGAGNIGSATAFSWMKGVAMAASFVLGILLAAAFTTASLTRTETGWTLDTSLLRKAASAPEAPEAQPNVASSIDSPTDDQAAVARVPGGQAQSFRISTSEFGIAPILVEMPGKREQQLRLLVREMVVAAEQRQQQQMDSLLTDLYQTFDSQRTRDLSVVFDELGLLRSSTGLELQRTNEVIDFLVTRVGTDMQAQIPDQRDD